MSWQSYVDDMLVGTKKVKKAAIIGHQGGVWAKSADFNIDPKEIQVLCGSWNHGELMQNGIDVEGGHYMCLRCEENIMYGRKGDAGLQVFKTNRAVIVATYEAPMSPPDAAKAVEKLGEFLTEVGY